MRESYELIIIGAGPSGLTAALYAARAGIKTVIFDKLFAGGQVLLTESIENFPGFYKGIKAQAFIENLVNQVKDLGIEIRQEEAVKIISNEDSKIVKTDQSEYNTKALIIATGANPKKLGIKGERQLTAKGVSYCAVCDGALFRNKIVSVIGGGDRALEEALYLSKIAAKVYLIHRRDKFRAAKIIQDRILANKKIEVVYSAIVTEIEGEDRLKHLILKNTLTQKIDKLKCDGVFIAIGLVPNTAFIKDLVKVDKNGFVLTDDTLSTNISGIFAAGDCRKNNLKQVITACSEGAIAVNSAKAYLDAVSK